MSLVGKRTALCLISLIVLAVPAGAEIVLEAEYFAIRIDDAGAVRGLVDRRDGANYQATDQLGP